MATEKQATAAKRAHSKHLLAHPGVSGVGVEKDDRGEYVLTVHVDGEKVGRDAKDIPSELSGVPVRCVASGPFRKH